MLVYLPLHLLLQWSASRFMEHLRMKLASYKFKFYRYFPLKNISKCYQFCELRPFLILTINLLPLTLAGKQNLH